MSTPSISRVSAGTPDGGRFAPAGRSEADIDLYPTGLTAPERSDLLAQRTRLREEAGHAQARADVVEMQLLADDLGAKHPDYPHVYVIPGRQGEAQVELYNEFGGVHVLGSSRPGQPVPPDEDLATRLAQLAGQRNSAFYQMLRKHEASGSGVPIADLAAADKFRMQQESDRLNRGEAVLEDSVGEVVRNLLPDAVSWNVGTEEFDNGYFYTPSALWAKKADGTEQLIDLWEIPGPEGERARLTVEDALAQLGDRDGPLGERAVHQSDIRAAG